MVHDSIGDLFDHLKAMFCQVLVLIVGFRWGIFYQVHFEKSFGKCRELLLHIVTTEQMHGCDNM